MIFELKLLPLVLIVLLMFICAVQELQLFGLLQGSLWYFLFLNFLSCLFV